MLDIPYDMQEYGSHNENGTANDPLLSNEKIDQLLNEEQGDSKKLSVAALEEAAAASAKPDKHFTLFKEATSTNSCQVWSKPFSCYDTILKAVRAVIYCTDPIPNVVGQYLGKVPVHRPTIHVSQPSMTSLPHHQSVFMEHRATLHHSWPFTSFFPQLPKDLHQHLYRCCCRQHSASLVPAVILHHLGTFNCLFLLTYSKLFSPICTFLQ